jgi:hypothetical protein
MQTLSKSNGYFYKIWKWAASDIQKLMANFEGESK